MERFSNKDNPDQALVIIQYSAKNKAIRLVKTDDIKQGYVFTCNPEKTGKSGYTAIGKMLKNMRVVRGDYISTKEHPDIFVYSENPELTALLNPEDPVNKYRVEDSNIEEGDIVCWVWRDERREAREKGEKSARKTRMATGRVLSIQQGDKANIEPISLDYRDTYPSRLSVNIAFTKLIIREKNNA